MKTTQTLLSSIGAVLFVATAANAASYTTLNLPINGATSTLVADITQWSDGGAYSGLFPSSQNFSGVPFQLQNNSGYNVLMDWADVSVNVFGVSNVYTLINTAWGDFGATVGDLTFYGSGGAVYSVSLVEGGNVRDHFFGGFVNTTSDSYVTQAVVGANTYGAAHLDMQNFALPTAFQSQTLTHFVFNPTGGYTGSPFLAGATVAAVPVPAAAWLLGSGLLGLAGVARRKAV